MLGLNSANKSPQIPEGYILLRSSILSVRKINRLLSRCNQDTHQPRKLELALESSDFYLTLLQKGSDNLVGFVRVTSDKGLNANLWDLSAEPGDQQEKFISIIVYKAIEIIRRELPGCSISVAAPLISLKALKANGFLLDPNGIKTMGYRL
tara:strand:- start:200 stop:652 length:453 start_codon:yes stop_codon:yes gene_type:complete